MDKKFVFVTKGSQFLKYMSSDRFVWSEDIFEGSFFFVLNLVCYLKTYYQ